MNKILVVTRHAAAQNIITKMFPDYQIEVREHYKAGDETGFEMVVGILPINLVADLNAKGVRFQMLTMNIPAELRGVELTEEQMAACGVKLEEFEVKRTPVRKIMSDFEIADALGDHFGEKFTHAIPDMNMMTVDEEIDVLNAVLEEANYGWRIEDLQETLDDCYEWVMIKV